MITIHIQVGKEEKMRLEKYGLVVKHRSYSATNYESEFKSDSFYTKIVGVRDDMEALEVIKKMIDEGIQLVEFCGAFDSEEIEALQKELILHQVIVDKETLVISPRHC